MNTLRTKLGRAAVGATLLLGGAAGAYALTGAAGAQDTTSTTAAASSSGQDSTAPNSTAKNSTAPNSTAPSGAPQGAPQGGPQGRPQQDPSKGGHTANGITETLLTGDDLTKATAAAEAAVPGGTVQRAETDAEGAAFEVHVAKSDGSQVTMKLDASFKVTSTEDGMK